MKVQMLKGNTTRDMAILLDGQNLTLVGSSAKLTGTEPTGAGIFSADRFVDFFSDSLECEVDFGSPWRNDVDLEYQIRERVAKVKQAFVSEEKPEESNANYFSYFYSGVLSQVILRATFSGCLEAICLRDYESIYPHVLSRLLTNTNNENGDGIFTIRSGSCVFHKKERNIRVNFPEPLSLGCNLDKIIRKRIDLVEKAFANKKAPESQKEYYCFEI